MKSELKDFFNNCDLGRFDDYPGIMFYRLYGVGGHIYRVYIDNDDSVKYIDGLKYFTKIEKNLKFAVDTRHLINYLQDNDSFETIILNDGEWVFVGKEIPFLTHMLVTSKEDDTDTTVDVWCKPNDIEWFVDILKGGFKKMDKNTECSFGIATTNGGGSIYTSFYDYTPKHVDIEQNYNDDFKVPYEKICEIIEKKNETGLMLFYGEPGTGKSSVIKNLIGSYPETDFIFIDANLLANTQQNSLISYFVENQNTVFILEDCEKALLSREEGFNPIISTLLNVTDGIIGDVLGIKLICTFNTSLSKIDKALLRNGRLSLKYEFKKLTSDKVSNILGRKVNEDMTLADIYNIDNENDFSKQEKRKVGFNT